MLALPDDILADRVQQVRLAEANAAVEEKGIVRFPRRLGDGLRCGVGKIVIVADNKCFEGISGVEPVFRNRGCPFSGQVSGPDFDRGLRMSRVSSSAAQSVP